MLYSWGWYNFSITWRLLVVRHVRQTFIGIRRYPHPEAIGLLSAGARKGQGSKNSRNGRNGGNSKNSGKMIIAVKPARISKLRYYQRRLFYRIALRNQATSLLQPTVWTARVTTSL